MDYGAVAASYYDDESYYSSNYNSYYTNRISTTNHAITVVGWNDEFPKENFVTTAPGDGAWLLRNSWGGTGESHYSYFWISYYDTSIAEEAYAMEFDSTANYDNNYQYDGAMISGTYSNGGRTDFKGANVFTAKSGAAKEQLEAVSFFSYNVNISYTIDIYTNLTRASDPTSGTLVSSAETTGVAETAGYYTVPLRQPVLLEQGESYAVVVNFHKDSGEILMAIESDGASNWYNVTASAEAGQSFISMGSSWLDVGVSNDTNLRIKAFTNDVTGTGDEENPGDEEDPGDEEPVAQTHTITYILNGGMNNSANPTSFTTGAGAVNLFNPSRTGYQFEGWYTEESFMNSITTISSDTDQDVTLYAKWKANTYRIYFNRNGGTAGSMPLQNVSYGVETELTTNQYTRAGYTFAGWNTNAAGTGTSYSDAQKIENLTTVNGATITLYAQWATRTYKITYKLNGGRNHKSNPSSYNVTTAKIMLKNPTRKGYTFGGWYTSSSYKTKIASIAKGSAKNYTLYARWNKVSVTKGSITSLQNTATRKMKVTAKKISGASGYQISYATNSKFTGSKTVTVSKNTVTFSKLTKGKTYYVRARAYKLDSTGARVNGSWSAAKKVKIRK